MQPDQRQYRIDKTKRITEVIADCAAVINKLLPAAYPRKRPRICKRMPARAHAYRRAQIRQQSLSRAQLAISLAIGVAQTHIIISQPIPKYPPGGAIINNGQQAEEVIRPGDTDGTKREKYSACTIIPKTNAIQPLPTGQRYNF